MNEKQSNSSNLELPTLADLEPIANFIAMRFALAGVSSNKVYQILEVFHYHCVDLDKPTRSVNLELVKLTNWLTQSGKEFKDEDARNVLAAVLDWYKNQWQGRLAPPDRRRIKKSVADFLMLVTWKYNAFGKDKIDRIPEVLAVKRGGCKVNLYLRYTKNDGTKIYAQVDLAADGVDLLREFHEATLNTNQAIASLKNARGELELPTRARRIREDLEQATNALPWQAKLAVGIKFVEGGRR